MAFKLIFLNFRKNFVNSLLFISSFVSGNLFKIYLFAFLAAPLGYFIKIIYAQNFSIVEFGLIYSIIGLLSLISIFNDFGFTETLNYYATRYFEEKIFSKVKGSLIFAVLMQASTAIIVSILLYYFSPFLAREYFKSDLAVTVLRSFIPYFFFYNLSRPLIELMNALYKYHMNSLAEFIRLSMILLFSSLIFLFPHMKSSEFIGWSWSLTYVFVFLIFASLVFIKRPEIIHTKGNFTKKLFKKLFNYAIYVVVGSGALLLLGRIDILLLTYFTSLSDVGLYTVALSLALIIPLILTPLNSMIFPFISKLVVKKDFNKIRLMFSNLYILGLYLFMPVLILFWSYSRELLNLLFGDSFLGAYTPLRILSVAYFLSVFLTFNYSFFAGLGLVKLRTKIMYLGAFLNVVFDLIAIPIFGLIGAALGTLLSISVMVFVGFVLIYKHLYISFSFLSIGKTLLLNFTLLLLILSLKPFIAGMSFYGFILLFIVAFTFYLFLGIKFKLFDINEFKKLLLKI